MQCWRKLFRVIWINKNEEVLERQIEKQNLWRIDRIAGDILKHSGAFHYAIEETEEEKNAARGRHRLGTCGRLVWTMTVGQERLAGCFNQSVDRWPKKKSGLYDTGPVVHVFQQRIVLHRAEWQVSIQSREAAWISKLMVVVFFMEALHESGREGVH